MKDKKNITEFVISKYASKKLRELVETYVEDVDDIDWVYDAVIAAHLLRNYRNRDAEYELRNGMQVSLYNHERQYAADLIIYDGDCEKRIADFNHMRDGVLIQFLILAPWIYW